MSWIRTIPFVHAEGRLRELYQRIKGPNEPLDQVLLVHSLRPHTLEGHMALYKGVLHHHGNQLPKWLLETIGIYVSLLNGCAYCVAHHRAGLCRLLPNEERAAAIFAALEGGQFVGVFEERERAILGYARQLTQSPATVAESAIIALRTAGLDDGEILEVNQISSYFAYVNRTVLGLGVTTTGDILGLSPGDNADPLNWQHG